MEIGVPVATRTTPPPELDEAAQAALGLTVHRGRVFFKHRRTVEHG
jgi:hypothetical protein